MPYHVFRLARMSQDSHREAECSGSHAQVDGFDVKESPGSVINFFSNEQID